jgi:hypothetical protein
LDVTGVREAVEAQATARVQDDVAAFASSMTPQAVLKLGGNGAGAHALPRARTFDILDITDTGDAVAASVRFRSRGVSYVLRTTWRSVNGLWTAVDAQVPPESIHVSWWRRLFGRAPSVPVPTERRDLS